MNIENADNRPPEMLIIPAVAPLVTKAKRPLTAAIVIAEGKPRLPAANMVIIFENPGFAPGGKKGIGGIRLSRKLNESARAHSMPISAIL